MPACDDASATADDVVECREQPTLLRFREPVGIIDADDARIDEGLGRPVGAGAVIVILVIVAALAGLVFVVMPLVSTEATRIAAKVPDLLNRVQEQWLPWLNAELGTSFSLDLAELSAFVREHIGAMGGVSGKLLGSLQVGGQAIIGLIVNLTLVPVVMFYVLRDWRSEERRVGKECRL